MEKAKHSIEFEAEVDGEGTVHFSRTVSRELHLKEGARVTVRIIGGVLSKVLAARNVTEEEIERIGRIQFEDREQVVKFLSSEGALSRDRAFWKRAKGLAA